VGGFATLYGLRVVWAARWGKRPGRAARIARRQSLNR
jgi:hypothetical protein